MQSESINWREALVLTVVAAAIIGTFAMTGQAQMSTSIQQMERKQLGDLFAATQCLPVNRDATRKVSSDKFKDLVGRGFLEYCFKQRLFDTDMLRKCVAIKSVAEDKAGDAKIADGEGEFTQSNCSYATTKGGDLLLNLTRRGDKRAIIYCWDSRNWMNAGAAGVLVVWSDGENGEFIDAARAKADYGISAEDFLLPDDKLIGKIKPFDTVFEEEACGKAAKDLREENERCKIYTELYKKKGRSWTMQGRNRPDDPKESRLKQEVIEVTDQGASVKWTITDLEGKPVPGAPDGHIEEKNFAAAKSLAPEGKRDGDKTEEIEAAGRKWKCEAWLQKHEDMEATLWYSTEFPGLIVLVKLKDGKELGRLIEFNDPK